MRWAPHDLTRGLIGAGFALLLAVTAGDALAKPARHHAPAQTAVPAGTVSAADPRAAAAGVEILRAGGSATDAAIAMMLALNVVEPQNSGLGGGAFYIRHDGATGRVSTIDGRETAPGAATPDWFLGPDGQRIAQDEVGGRSAGVPGALALIKAAYQASGRLPWARLFQPAIRLAQDGASISMRMHNGLDLYGRHVEGWAKTTYFGADGQPLPMGTMLRLPLTARTLRKLAAAGPAKAVDMFYHGPMAARAVAALNAAQVNPSRMTTADYAGYKAIPRDPVCGTYRGWKICGMGPPSSGGVSVLMILKQLERFDMGALGRASPVAWHLLAESERLAYADRDMYLADPAYVSVPVAGLLDPAYISARSALISPDRTMATISAGTPAGAPARQPVAFRDDPGTTDLAVVDGAGNLVQVTATINGYFGSGLASDGLMLNNELPDFDAMPVKAGAPVANRVEGGKRPRSSMAPTIVYDPSGQPRLAIGAAGGATIICQVAKALIGVIDWHMSAQDAIAMGLVFAPMKGGRVEAGTELVAMLPALSTLGETLSAGPMGLKANAVERVSDHGGSHWVGAADPRSEGVGMDTLGNVMRIPRRSNELNGAHE